MTKSTHTPGPWTINNWPQPDARISIGAIGTPLIAYVPLRDLSINEQKANARLIAAAPDMLAALRGLLACAELNQDDLEGDTRMLIDNAEALLTRVEGSNA